MQEDLYQDLYQDPYQSSYQIYVSSLDDHQILWWTWAHHLARVGDQEAPTLRVAAHFLPAADPNRPNPPPSPLAVAQQLAKLEICKK